MQQKPKDSGETSAPSLSTHFQFAKRNNPPIAPSDLQEAAQTTILWMQTLTQDIMDSSALKLLLQQILLLQQFSR